MAITPICGIYKITNSKKRVYIGKSINIEKRFNDYRLLKCKSQTALFNSLRKHGYANHKFEIIEQCNESELNEKEIYYIALYQCFNSKYGMNLRDGGQGGSWTDESKAKISKTKTGVPNHKIAGEGNGMFGKTHTEEVRRQSSIRNSGSNNFLFGKHHSEETKRKIGEAQTGEKSHSFGKVPYNLGKPHSEETKKKMKEAAEKRKLRDGYKGKKGNTNYDIKKIDQYSLDNIFIKTFDNFIQIKNELGFSKRVIKNACIGITLSTHGFKWKFNEQSESL